MSMETAINMVRCFGILAASTAAGAYGYIEPDAVMPATHSAITVLCIVVGLSAAVSSLLIAADVAPHHISNDPAVAKRVSARLIRQDRRTANRLKYIQTAALLAIVFGLAYQVVGTATGYQTGARVLAAVFVFTAVLSLLFAMALPGLFGHLQKRNDRIWR